MKKRGFTLTELLGVIIILGVIALIIFPNVNKSIKNSKQKLYDQQVALIEENARKWGVEHSGELPDGGSYFLELNDLVLGGYISQKEFKDPRNGNTMTGCVVISYDSEYNQYKYTYSEVSCNEQKPVELPLLAQKIRESSELMTNDPDKNPRYVGANPSNYVKFNNELWRIIGIFDGQVKIIKDDAYGTEIAWDTNNTNNWTEATFQKELNEIYLYDIDDKSRSYIDQEHVWKLGGWTDSGIKRADIYNYERGDSVYGENPTEWTGAIALMYPSDWAYASSGACDDILLSSWNSETSFNECLQNSWLYKDTYHQYTLSPLTINSHHVFAINSGGILGRSGAESANSHIVNPVLYLKSNIKVSGGIGTKERPYILSL